MPIAQFNMSHPNFQISLALSNIKSSVVANGYLSHGALIHKEGISNIFGSYKLVCKNLNTFEHL